MKKFTYTILMLIIGGLIGYAIELFKSSEQGRIRYIDKEVLISKSVLNLPTLPAQKIEVLLNDAKVEHITEVRVILSNFEDRDFSDIPIFVTIVPKEGEYVDVIAKDAYVGPSKSRDRISEYTKVKVPLKIEFKKFGFKVHTLNRARTYEDKAFLLFYLLGKVEPEIIVSIDKAGLELRPYSFDRHYESIRPISSKVITFAIVIGFLIFSILYFYIFYWYTFKYQRNKTIKKRIANINHLRDLFETKYTDHPVKNLAAHLIYELERNDYMKLSRLDKLFYNEPKESEFLDVKRDKLYDRKAEQENSAEPNGRPAD